jgi:hypothetical protein
MMLHILKSAFVDGLVQVQPKKPVSEDASDSIFGLPFSEASDSVRAELLDTQESTQFTTVSVSHDSSTHSSPVANAKSCSVSRD